MEKKETKTTLASKANAKKPVKAAEKKEPKIVNTIENILNPNNNDTVVLFDDKNQPVEFEQIALIPVDENLYCILKPVKNIEGIGQDEAVAFLIQEDKEGLFLDVVDDDAVIDNVFDAYYQLFEEANKQKK